MNQMPRVIFAGALVLYILAALVSLEKSRNNERQSFITNEERLSDSASSAAFLR